MNVNRPEMLHCSDMTLLERQRARFKWQQQQQQQQHNFHHQEDSFSAHVFQVQPPQQGFLGGLNEVLMPQSQCMKPDPDLVENGWPDFCGFRRAFDVNFAVSITSSCPPAEVQAAAAEVAMAVADKGGESVGGSKKVGCGGVGRESFKKRKVQNNAKVVAEGNSGDKRIKGCAEKAESKVVNQKNSNIKTSSSNNNNNSSKNNNSNKENSAETSKDNSKVTEVQKPDYVHVRARRGQATDSHSLAERVRREKISERMKYLQDLVPGCNKITGKAGMLDEIINYVQSLQRQVEFLSMKLAAVNPRLDFNIENLFAKETFPACAANYSTIGMSSDMTSPPYLQFNPVQQQLAACRPDMGINPPDMGPRRTISALVSLPETFIDSTYFNQIQPSSICDADLQNLYNVAFDQGRSSTLFPSQPLTGSIEAGNLKMEM